MRRALRSFALLLVLFALLPALSQAQVQLGTPPFGSFGGGPDVINLANLNSHLTVPVLHKAGRSLPFNFFLTYNSSVWTPSGASGSQTWQPAKNFGWNGSELRIGNLVAALDSSSTICSPRPNEKFINTETAFWHYIDGWGTSHQFPGQSSVTTNQCTYSDSTPAVTFNYNQSSAFGVTLTNTLGRISSVSTAGASPTGSVFSYDTMGRLIDNSQCTPQNCGTGTYTLQYPQYDLAGDLVSATNAAGITFSYAYDTAARLTTMTSNFVDGSHPGTLFSNAVHGPIGLTSDSLGNGIIESLTYTNRQFLQSLTANSGTTTAY